MEVKGFNKTHEYHWFISVVGLIRVLSCSRPISEGGRVRTNPLWKLTNNLFKQNYSLLLFKPLRGYEKLPSQLSHSVALINKTDILVSSLSLEHLFRMLIGYDNFYFPRTCLHPYQLSSSHPLSETQFTKTYFTSYRYLHNDLRSELILGAKISRVQLCKVRKKVTSEVNVNYSPLSSGYGVSGPSLADPFFPICYKKFVFAIQTWRTP